MSIPKFVKNEKLRRKLGKLTPETVSRNPVRRSQLESQEYKKQRGKPSMRTQQKGWCTRAMAREPKPRPRRRTYAVIHSAKGPRSGPRKALREQKRQCCGLKRPRVRRRRPTPVPNVQIVCGPGPGITDSSLSTLSLSLSLCGSQVSGPSDLSLWIVGIRPVLFVEPFLFFPSQGTRFCKLQGKKKKIMRGGNQRVASGLCHSTSARVQVWARSVGIARHLQCSDFLNFFN